MEAKPLLLETLVVFFLLIFSWRAFLLILNFFTFRHWLYCRLESIKFPSPLYWAAESIGSWLGKPFGRQLEKGIEQENVIRHRGEQGRVRRAQPATEEQGLA